MSDGFQFNPPPGWPVPPPGWTPPDGWAPDPGWPPAPAGWQFWVLNTPPPPPPPSLVTAEGPSDVSPSSGHTEAAPHTDVEVTGPEPEPTDVAPPLEPHAEVQQVAESDRGVDADRLEVAQLRAQIRSLEADLAALQSSAPVSDEVVDLDDERVLQEVGIYRYHHPLESAAAYQDRLKDLQGRIKEAIKSGEAIEASELFTFNNSLARGRKMTADLSKLMLRAYNAEADIAVRALRAGNVQTATKRLDKSRNTIARLGALMEMSISDTFHDLRLEELELTADWLMKVQEEREDAREERERLREERKAERELAAERERLDKERAHLANALESVSTGGDAAAIAELQAKLAGLDQAIEQNDFRLANIRAGYVYVISNRGAFGPHIVKIGLTRRLEPMDRVRELGDASVPFRFDVHALYFSEDAVTLENELHQAFEDRRVNHVNLRREFFFATPEEVRSVLMEKVGNLLEFTDHPDATEYHQSRSLWPAETIQRSTAAG